MSHLPIREGRLSSPIYYLYVITIRPLMKVVPKLLCFGNKATLHDNNTARFFRDLTLYTSSS
jgi:hypothetical protein